MLGIGVVGREGGGCRCDGDGLDVGPGVWLVGVCVRRLGVGGGGGVVVRGRVGDGVGEEGGRG